MVNILVMTSEGNGGVMVDGYNRTIQNPKGYEMKCDVSGGTIYLTLTPAGKNMVSMFVTTGESYG